MKKKYMLLCLVLLVLCVFSIPANAEDTGSITLDFTQFIDQMEMAKQSENPSYGIATTMPVKPTEFTSMNIRVVKVEDGIESTCLESNITTLGNISLVLDPGTYKVYTQLEGDDTVLEYNNDSEGYVIAPRGHLVIPMVYPPYTEGFILDVPWRIEKSEIYVPILAVDTGVVWADLYDINVYDHYDGDRLVASTNWSSLQPIYLGTPFFYLFNIDNNSFVQVDGEISIRIKFELHWYPDNWEGPKNVKISEDDIPNLVDWYCGDTHLHTNYTHNVYEFGAPIYATRAANNAMGLDWMIVTDHSFDLNPDKWNVSTADCDVHSDNLFRVFQGEEVSCYLPGTDINPGQYQYNHLLVYGTGFIPGGEWEDGTGSDYTPAEVIAIANGQGGVTYPAHPMYSDLFRDSWQNYSLNFTGLQIWSSGDNIAKLESGIEIWKELLLDGRHVYVEGGTDAHGDFNTRAGRVKTFVYIPEYSQDSLPLENDILEALRNGHSIMTDGPLVIFNITNEHGDTAIIGNETAGSNLTLKIQWESTSEFGNVDHIYVHRGIIGETEEEISEYHLTPNSFSGAGVYPDLASKIPLSRSAYIRINATTDKGNRVYSNPIWVTSTQTPTLPLHNLDTGEDFATIQAAIYDSDTDNGHTITVDAGTYNENVVVNKSITLQGEDRENTIIDGNRSGDVIKVTADDCEISGFTVRNSGSGDAGIYLYYSDNNILTNNNVSNNGDGIYLYYSSGNKITNNNANANNAFGIYLKSSRNNTVTNNIASNLGRDIYLGYSSNNIVANNSASKSGIGLASSNYNTVANNSANTNSIRDGIILSLSSYNTVSNNTANSNFKGIYLTYYSSYNTIANNDVKNNDKGFELSSSYNNLFMNNTASNNKCGIFPIDSNDNKVYLNNFVDNTNNVYSYNSTNIWNSTSKITYTYNGSTYTNYLGNYWNDYTGSDGDSDGIGEIPYSIDGDKDNYPLMEQWERYFAPTPTPTPVFDTGSPSNPYPSISGTHTGTITPNQDITVQKMYTYPCTGTGGHSEYVAFYHTYGTKIAEGNWTGYTDDWHNISFDKTFTLVKGETYNYTIRTGSYPRIIHETSFNATGGTITCVEFIDANGRRYDNWIPAIRLE